LIITIPIQNHSVNLNLPVNPSPPTDDKPVVVNIDIDFDGTVSWNGETVDKATVDARLAQVAATPVQPEVHIRPNKLVEYKAVAAVMASAQRQGVTKIGLVGNEQFL
jgi:biopolymer transport protein ExbD